MLSDHRLAQSAPLAVLTTVVLGAIALTLGVFLTSTGVVTAAELRFLEILSLGHSAPATALALAINSGFGTVGAVVVSVAVAVVVAAVMRSVREGLWTLVMIAVPWGCVEAIKLLVARPRPDMAALSDVLVAVPPSTSFPSGHTAFATALGCALVWMVARRSRAVWPVVAAICVAAILGIVTAWSRMYLGVHQPTDVATALVFVPVASWATAAFAIHIAPVVRSDQKSGIEFE